jgi:phage terminase Nu1 subunit (DNA packaging protein)
MTTELPEYYFRVRENGAAVFRVSTENRQRRIEMDEIASVNVKNGTIKPHGDVTLSPADLAAIGDWIADRQAQLAAREVDDILRTVDHLNLTTHWAQSRATDEQLEAVTDRLLLTMHDLRTVLVRKKADRLGKAEG